MKHNLRKIINFTSCRLTVCYFIYGKLDDTVGVENINIEDPPYLKCAAITSVDVERSYSRHEIRYQITDGVSTLNVQRKP